MKQKRFTCILVLIAFSFIALAYFLVGSLKLVSEKSAKSDAVTEIQKVSDPVDSEQVPEAPWEASNDRVAPVVEHAGASVSDPDSAVVQAAPTESAPEVAGAPANPEAVLVDRTPLAESPVAARWKTEMGTTVEDIHVVQSRLRREGFPEEALDDPRLVRQFLPRRHVASVNIHSVEIPERAPSGQPVPFRLSGALPDRSFEFTRFDISRQDDLIRIRPMGNSSGDVVPGVEVPIELDGELAPLSPGVYRIEFPDLGPDGLYELIIE